MTPSILGLTFNDLTSLYRTKPEINTSKSETAPPVHTFPKKELTNSRQYAIQSGAAEKDSFSWYLAKKHLRLYRTFWSS